MLYKNSLVPFSYWVIFILILGCIGLVISLPEQPVSKGALIRLPSFPDGTLPAGLAIALAWSLSGIVGVILPAQLVQYNLPNWSGPLLFIFVMTGVLLQPFARRLEAVLSLQLGAAILVLGYITFTCGAWLGILGAESRQQSLAAPRAAIQQFIAIWRTSKDLLGKIDSRPT